MVSPPRLLLALATTFTLAAADWRLIVSYDGVPTPYVKNGLTNSGCTKLPNSGYWANWFDYQDNSYTDTVCFYNKPDCTGTKWCYQERDSGGVGAKDFRSYKVY
jgi:hypothetical protein